MVTVERNDHEVRIHVRGEFTFKLRQAFRDAYFREPPGAHYVVDMSGVNFMDSSAMGMLLVLREHAGGEQSRVTLTNLSRKLMALMKVASLHEMFKIV
ncbi:MAG: STAS domain-containing protein [Magnetococcales bacterium]|nr:STAS domain-containing protein [Magnetococcales bacterium]